MILYDKNGTFLGMGQDELSALGYEDMGEFKSYFDDFADLFVNRPGYISNFKNFSWIDYILHSGTPNKNVIIKQKNGTEIESGLIISEVSLTQEINGSSTLYCIEFETNSNSSHSHFEPNIKLPNIEEELMIQETEKTPILEKNDMDLFIKNKYDEDFQDSHTNLNQNDDKYDDNEIKISTTDNFGNKPIHHEIATKAKEDDFKLKIDMDEDFQPQAENNQSTLSDLSITEEAKELLSIDEIPIMSQEFQNHLKSTSEPEVDIEPKESLDEKPQKTESIDSKNIEFENLDFTKIAEDTGIDLGDIATFIEDFIAESKSYLKKIQTNDNPMDIKSIKSGAMELNGIASNLKMEKISNTLNSILQNSTEDKTQILIKQLQVQIEDLQEQLF